MKEPITPQSHDLGLEISVDYTDKHNPKGLPKICESKFEEILANLLADYPVSGKINVAVKGKKTGYKDKAFAITACSIKNHAVVARIQIGNVEECFECYLYRDNIDALFAELRPDTVKETSHTNGPIEIEVAPPTETKVEVVETKVENFFSVERELSRLKSRKKEHEQLVVQKDNAIKERQSIATLINESEIEQAKLKRKIDDLKSKVETVEEKLSLIKQKLQDKALKLDLERYTQALKALGVKNIN